MSDLLLVTPPFTQLNTPYPATAYLKGFLRTKEISNFQVDLGIEVILSLFSSVGLRQIFDFAIERESIVSDNALRIYTLREDYIQTIDEVVLFLQGNNQTFARQICTDNFLPQANKLLNIQDTDWAFGSMGIQDHAKHIATLYLEDLSDFIVECVDDQFGFSRYAERLGRSANSFDELYDTLKEKNSFIDDITLAILKLHLNATQPKLICFSVPFPGNLYSAFRCAKYIQSNYPDIKVAMGGGFPNTELRSVSDVRVFEFFDFITLDDGELPIELLASNVLDPTNSNSNIGFFKRTFLIENGEVVYNNFSIRQDYKQVDLGTPDYSDLLLDKYISVIEVANPMHSLWSDGRWNKLTMAHGCYWGKCTFCDVSLDYIGKYEPITASMLVDRMEEMIEQTGENGFHFVDEAAPPALMRAVAIEIVRRKLTLTWWTNIRFEKSFNRDLCLLLKASGCIAVSGGLEVASDRLLDLIQKGVTVEQVAQVTRNFTEAGVMVHAYLMYGYPTQTIQETVDSLEIVRQLIENGVIQSGFWHQFALTAHSPVGLSPKDYGIEPHYADITFANNDVAFTDSTGIDHEIFSEGLRKSLFNYMHGICFEYDLQEWFDFEIPQTSIAPDYIINCIESEPFPQVKSSSKIVWLGNMPTIEIYQGESKGLQVEYMQMTFHDKRSSHEISMVSDKGQWLIDNLEDLKIDEGSIMTYGQLKSSYEESLDDFTLFWFGDSMTAMREIGLLVL
ncbi:MAG: radical SAM protein [Saprospiraceae bacterium]